MNVDGGADDGMRKKCAEELGVDEAMHNCMEQMLNRIMKNPSLCTIIQG